MPLMYGPYYCWLAREAADSVALAITFACAMQLALAGLLNLMLGLEDPFHCANFNRSGRFDRVKVVDLVEVARRQMLRVEREAKQPWAVPATRESWYQDDDDELSG